MKSKDLVLAIMAMVVLFFVGRFVYDAADKAIESDLNNSDRAGREIAKKIEIYNFDGNDQLHVSTKVQPAPPKVTKKTSVSAPKPAKKSVKTRGQKKSLKVPAKTSEKKDKTLSSTEKTKLLMSGRPLNCNAVSRRHGSWSQNHILKEACRMSKGDGDFLLTMLTECPDINPKHISVPNSDGTRDHGLLQFNDRWEKRFVESESFVYWDVQLYHGLKLFRKNPYLFCAYKVRYKSIALLVISRAA
jgi:hypothetical protein